MLATGRDVVSGERDSVSVLGLAFLSLSRMDVSACSWTRAPSWRMWDSSRTTSGPELRQEGPVEDAVG